jgi:antitoxin component YwqK of YwqJK toxin-antitoxin module
MLGYKAAKNGDTRVLITLEIPEDALTNIERTSVKVKETAKYRANKVKILKIEDSEGKEYETAETGFFSKKKVVYKVGEVLEVPTDDMDVEQVCSNGIHFFLERKVAEMYYLYLENGIYMSWHENGQKEHEGMMKDGKREGLWQTWYDNGQKYSEGMWKEGNQEGLREIWYETGQKKSEQMWKEGNQEGLRQIWYENGQKSSEGMMKDGKREGLWQTWYDNGQKSSEQIWKGGWEDGVWQTWYENEQKSSEEIWKNGKLEGLRQTWHRNGQKSSEEIWKNGKREGLWQTWYANGQKCSEGMFDGTLDDNPVGEWKCWDENGNSIPYNRQIVMMGNWDDYPQL